MCGRFAQTIPLGKLKMTDLFSEADADYLVSFNVAPSHYAAVVSQKGEKRVLTLKKWGLVPSWSKDDKTGNRLINARGESIREKPSFRNGFRRGRCIIPVTGFYEWRSEGGIKRPYFVHMSGSGKDFYPMLLAGLHESWNAPDGKQLDTFTIITTSAADKLKSLHDRMPVIIAEADIEKWFSETLPAAEIEKLLKPASDHMIDFYPVSEYVNSPFNNSEKCLEAI